MSEKAFHLFKADDSLFDILVENEESGMGYQIVEMDEKVYYVFNAKYLLLEDDDDAFRKYVSEFERDDDKDLFIQLFEEEVLGLPRSEVQVIEQPRKKGILTKTKANEAFYRFNAFLDDSRMIVGGGGKFKKGTYATTYADIRMVPSGLAAVGRYALPDPRSAQFVYILFPPKDTKIVICTVAPKFNQAGGGVEVFFPDEVEFEYQPHKISRS